MFSLRSPPAKIGLFGNQTPNNAGTPEEIPTKRTTHVLTGFLPGFQIRKDIFHGVRHPFEPPSTIRTLFSP